MSRRSYKNTKIIIIFMILSALAYAFWRVGLPFATSEYRGAKTTANLQDELLYRWDSAKRSNYNAIFQMALEVKDYDTFIEGLDFLPEYVEKHRGSILSKYEYIVRVPVSETKEFNTRVKADANLIKFSSDYSTALSSGSIEAYNDSLVVMQEKIKNLEKLRRENPNIKGYTQDIEETNNQIKRLNSLKYSLQNKDYDLYLIAFSENFKKGVSSSKYAEGLAKQFIIAFGILALAVPLIVLGSRLIFKVLGIVGAQTSQLYGNYYSKGYKYGNYSGYGYNYGRKRHVKRVYKDKDKGDVDKSSEK